MRPDGKRPLRVLYVEDNPADVEFVALGLRTSEHPFEFEAVKDLAAASARLDASEAARSRGADPGLDALLLDMHLPDGRGTELLARVRRRGLPFAVVVLTGTGDEGEALTALRAGADDYVVKRPGFWTGIPGALLAAVEGFASKAALLRRPLHLLYIEHNPADVDLTRIHLAAHAPHIQFQSCVDIRQALAFLREDPGREDVDVVMVDFHMPSMDALDFLKEIRQGSVNDVPVILVTGQGSEEVAVQAVKLGAMDYLVKSPGYLYRLPLAVESAFYRRQAQRERQALAAREAYLRTIIETEPEGVQVVSPDGVLMESNPAGLRMFEAATLEEARSRPLADFVVPEHKAPFRDLQKRVLAGESGSLVFGFIALKGSRRWLETHAVPMRKDAGPIERILCITRDITGRVEAEEKLRQGEKLTAIGQLAGGIAHDFNNQLSVILGYAELLSARLKDSETRRFAENIAQAARSSGELTRNLLTFSRRGHFETVPIDFHELIREVGELLRHSIDKRIEITRRLDAPGPTLMGDPATLQNALLNLSLNARDAMPSGGTLEFRTREVSLDAERNPDGEIELPPGRYLQVEVADTGTGMTEEVRKRIFEPFFTTKPVGKGTGMGLASVFGTVKMHRGRIRVESELGRGTRFQILLPLAEEPVEPVLLPESRIRTDRSLRILAVDDDPGVRDLVLDLLRAAGHRAIGAADGREALTLYRDRWRETDLVLLDMVMPEMDGQDTFHALRRINPSARVIILSGYSPEDKVQGLLTDGAAGYLRKPFSMAELDRMLAQVASQDALTRP